MSVRLLVLVVSLTACGEKFVTVADAGPDGSPADGGGPRISIVQATSTQIVGNVDPTLSLQTPPAVGNAVIVGITCFSDIDNCTIPPTGVTDNQNNTWLRVIEGNSIISSNTHGSRGYIFVAESIGPTSGAFTIRVNPNGDPPTNVQNFAWGAIEVAGLAPSGTLDRTGATPATCCNTSTTVSTSGATTVANELAVAVHTARSNDGDVAYGIDPSWTQQHVNVNGVSTASPHSMVTRVLGATGIVSHTWTHHAPTRGASAVIATFKGRVQ